MYHRQTSVLAWKKEVFSGATNNHRTITLALFRNRRVGCQFHVYLPFGNICGKVVYTFCGLIFQVKKKEKRKENEHKFQKKKEPREGN